MERYQELPPVPYANTQHTVTVTAMGVTTTGTFTLEIIEAPSITYPGSPFTFIKNTAVSGVLPINTLVHYPVTWTIDTGSLPSGLNLILQRRNFWNAYFGDT